MKDGEGDGRDDGQREESKESPNALGRRALLKRGGAVLGALVLAPACASDSPESDGDPTTGTGGASPGTGTGGATGGSSASTGGSGAGTGEGGQGAGTGGAPDPGGAGSGGDPAAGGAGAPAGGAGAPPTSGITVAIVREMDVDRAVARAVELAGGIDEIEAGQTVFIKPNFVSNRALDMPGIRTSLDVLLAVIRLVKARNPGHIVVGERSARSFDTAQVFADLGFTQAAMDAGADEIYPAPSPVTDPDAWMLMQPPSYEETWSGAGGILAMRKILEADHLVNVPTCKNHRYALFSMSMKNFIGAIGDSSRDPIHYADTLMANFDRIGRDIAVLNQIFSPLISIVDARTVLMNGGPQGDGLDAVRSTPGLILASKDRVALDALGVSLIKHELAAADVTRPDASNPLLLARSPWMFPQLQNAVMLGLGAANADAVELVFDQVDEAAALEAIFRG
jgi:uncharacterized protein (DUF362 family)